MKKSSTIALKIVLVGSDLDPASVSTALGFAPTDSYEKGFRKMVGGKLTKPRPVSMWCFKSEVASSIEDELESFLEKFGKLNVKSINGIERASLHIHLGLSNNESVIEESLDVLINPLCIQKIQNMGLDMRFTIS